jgi:hypothetical protein
MVDGLYILIQNKTKKLLIIPFSGVGRGPIRKDGRGDLISVQNKLFRIITMNPPCTTNMF